MLTKNLFSMGQILGIIVGIGFMALLKLLEDAIGFYGSKNDIIIGWISGVTYYVVTQMYKNIFK